MRTGTVTEKLTLTASVLVLSCATDHQVSPWGEGRAPSLSAYVAHPDLAAQLRAVDAETSELGLRLEVELRGALPRGGGELVVRGYRGADSLGRTTSAVRVATPRGVVMAVGPLDSELSERLQATELVQTLLPGAEAAGPRRAADLLGAFRSGTDLNGDGYPDVVLRSEAGAIEIWAVRSLGSTRYDVTLAVQPTFALDVNEDGWLDLAGRATFEQGDPIGPDLVDAATFEGGRYTDRSDAARAFHAARAAALAQPADARDGPPPVVPSDALRLRRALERAWHSVLAGEPRDATLEALGRQPVPTALRAAFDAHRTRIAGAGAARTDEGRPRDVAGPPARDPRSSASGTPAGR